MSGFDPMAVAQAAVAPQTAPPAAPAPPAAQSPAAPPARVSAPQNGPPAPFDPMKVAKAAVEGAEQAQHKITAPIDQTIRNWALNAVHAVGPQIAAAAAPVDAVLGAPQRAVAGVATALHQGHPEQSLQHAGDAIMHPDKADYYNEGERRLVGSQNLMVEHPQNFLDHARNAGVKFVTENALDPLNYVGLGEIHKVEQAGMAGLKLLPGAKQVAGAVDKITSPIRTAVDPTRGVAASVGTQKAGEIAAELAKAKQQAAQYFIDHPEKAPVNESDKLKLQEHLAQTIAAKNIPEAFGYNAPHYDALANKAPQPTKAGETPPVPPPEPGAQVQYPGGTTPPAAEPYKAPFPTMKQTPLGGNARTEGRGIPQANVIDKRDIGGPTMEEQGLPHPFDPMKVAQDATAPAAAGDLPGNTASAALRAQALAQKAKYDPTLTAHGRATMIEDKTPISLDPDIKQMLRDDPENQHLLEQWEKVSMPAAVHKAMQMNSPVTKKFLGGFPTHVADALKDVMFLNMIPHVKNELTMAYESPGGMGIVADGLRRAAQQNTPAWQQLTQHLQDIGASDGWFKERENLFGKVAALTGSNSPTALGKITSAPARALDWWSQFSQDQLFKIDNSLRQSMYLQQKRLHPDWDDRSLAGYIQSHMFNYGQQSELAEKLHAAGAPFAHWRIESPMRQGRAIVENPAATERIVRGENDVNSEIPKEAGYKLNFATPIDEMQKAANPASFFPYAASTLGEVYREPLRLMSGKDTLQDVVKDPVKGLGMYSLERFAPGGETVVDALENPFHSKADFLTRQGAGLAGIYPQNNPSRYTQKYQEYMSMPGMTSLRAKQSTLKWLRDQKAALR